LPSGDAPNSVEALAVRALLQTSCSTGERFLSRLGVGDEAGAGSEADDGVADDAHPLSTAVARALSETHWREETLQLRASKLRFIRPRGLPGRRRRTYLLLPLAEILSVEPLPAPLAPAPGMQGLVLATTGRLHYLMLGSAAQRDRWLHALRAQIGAASGRESPTTAAPCAAAPSGPPAAAAARAASDSATSCDEAEADTLVEFSDPSIAFFSASALWKPSRRRVLNCRRTLLPSASPPHPCDAVARALSLALELSSAREESPDGSVPNLRLVEFLDAACELRRCTPEQERALSESQRLAFLLNL
jgi:hypothetical protein